MRARQYDPLAGVWQSVDPVGFYGKDWNLYKYVRNNPTNYSDGSGMLTDLRVDLNNRSNAYVGYGATKETIPGDRRYAEGRIRVAGPGYEKVARALRLIFSTQIGQELLKELKKGCKKVWIYTGDFQLGQQIFGGDTLKFAGAYPTVHRINPRVEPSTSAVVIDTNNSLWTDVTTELGFFRRTLEEMPFDIILLHELGHAICKYKDNHRTNPPRGENVDKLENTYRAQRRAQIARKKGRTSFEGTDYFSGSYKPRKRYGIRSYSER